MKTISKTAAIAAVALGASLAAGPAAGADAKPAPITVTVHAGRALATAPGALVGSNDQLVRHRSVAAVHPDRAGLVPQLNSMIAADDDRARQLGGAHIYCTGSAPPSPPRLPMIRGSSPREETPRRR